MSKCFITAQSAPDDYGADMSSPRGAERNVSTASYSPEPGVTAGVFERRVNATQVTDQDSVAAAPRE